MENYYLIFINSLKSSIIFSTVAEYGWFAMRDFGGYNMLLASFMAIMGASLGTSFNYMAGYYLAAKRQDSLLFNDRLYQIIHRYSRYYLLILLFPFPDLFIIGQFYSLFVFAFGFLRHSPKVVIPLILAGRVLYYLFHYYHIAGLH